MSNLGVLQTSVLKLLGVQAHEHAMPAFCCRILFRDARAHEACATQHSAYSAFCMERSWQKRALWPPAILAGDVRQQNERAVLWRLHMLAFQASTGLARASRRWRCCRRCVDHKHILMQPHDHTSSCETHDASEGSEHEARSGR